MPYVRVPAEAEQSWELGVGTPALELKYVFRTAKHIFSHNTWWISYLLPLFLCLSVIWSGVGICLNSLCQLTRSSRTKLGNWESPATRVCVCVCECAVGCSVSLCVDGRMGEVSGAALWLGGLVARWLQFASPSAAWQRTARRISAGCLQWHRHRERHWHRHRGISS